MTDEEITRAARQVCAAQAWKKDSPESQNYLIGNYDHTVWMRLVKRGIQLGLEGQAMVKTQHCPNCEATEQKLHDFQQEVSDAVVDTEEKYGAVIRDNFGHFIIPKSDPLVEVMKQAGWAAAVIDSCAPSLRDALEARGLEIREKD